MSLSYAVISLVVRELQPPEYFKAGNLLVGGRTNVNNKETLLWQKKRENMEEKIIKTGISKC